MGSRRTAATQRALGFGFDQLVRRGLRGVWVRGELPAGPVVWAANHHSWWDGFVANAVLVEQGRAVALIMQGDNLADYEFLASMGVISTSRPRQALAAVQSGRVLIVFPEAEMRPPGQLADVAAGAGWFARQSSAALVPVAVRLAIRGHQYPEAYLDIGPPVEPAELADALRHQLQALDAELSKADPMTPLPDYRLVVRGRRSWDERISGWSSRFSR